MSDIAALITAVAALIGALPPLVSVLQKRRHAAGSDGDHPVRHLSKRSKIIAVVAAALALAAVGLFVAPRLATDSKSLGTPSADQEPTTSGPPPLSSSPSASTDPSQGVAVPDASPAVSDSTPSGPAAGTPSTVATTPAAAPPGGLVALWTFDGGPGGTALDAGGRHRLSLSDVSWTSGHGGDAVSFNGVDSQATGGPVVSTSHSLTVAAWVRLEPDPGHDYETIASENGSYTFGFNLRVIGGQWYFTTSSSDTPPDADPAARGPVPVGAVSQVPKRNGWTIAEQAGDRTPDRTQRLLNRSARVRYR